MIASVRDNQIFELKDLEFLVGIRLIFFLELSPDTKTRMGTVPLAFMEAYGWGKDVEFTVNFKPGSRVVP